MFFLSQTPLHYNFSHMVYKRYIKKDGKRLGPYYYESVRGANGKIRSVYLGTKPPAGYVEKGRRPRSPARNNWQGAYTPIILFVILCVAIAGFAIYNPLSPTGYTTLSGPDLSASDVGYEEIKPTMFDVEFGSPEETAILDKYGIIPLSLEDAMVLEELQRNPEPLPDRVKQSMAEVGKPVRWTREIKSSKLIATVYAELPNGSENINLYLMNGTRLGASLSGSDSAEGLIVEYYTEAPRAVENETSPYTKEITISSEMHYIDVLAYTNITESPVSSIHLYHKTNVSREPVPIREYIDANNNSMIDRISWLVPHLSNETYEVEITILNIQSYPTLGGNWTVNFTTVGMANLTISTANITTWSNKNWGHDLMFLEIRCGNSTTLHTWRNDSVFVEGYECNETGHETSLVLTTGKHDLMFQFGNETAYAHNDVGDSAGKRWTSNADFDGGFYDDHVYVLDGVVGLGWKYNFSGFWLDPAYWTSTADAGTSVTPLQDWIEVYAPGKGAAPYNDCLLKSTKQFSLATLRFKAKIRKTLGYTNIYRGFAGFGNITNSGHVPGGTRSMYHVLNHASYSGYFLAQQNGDDYSLDTHGDMDKDQWIVSTIAFSNQSQNATWLTGGWNSIGVVNATIGNQSGGYPRNLMIYFGMFQGWNSGINMTIDWVQVRGGYRNATYRTDCSPLDVGVPTISWDKLNVSANKTTGQNITANVIVSNAADCSSPLGEKNVNVTDGFNSYDISDLPAAKYVMINLTFNITDGMLWLEPSVDQMGVNGTELLGCGDLIAENTVLEANLDCSAGGSHGLIVNAGDITLDCDGYSITGSGAGGFNGVHISDATHDNVVVKNCNIINFNNGIYVINAGQANLSHNNLSNQVTFGIYLAFSNHTTTEWNRINDTGATTPIGGIYLWNSINNTIYHNWVDNYNGAVRYSIDIQSESNNTTISSNTLLDNWVGINLDNSDHISIIHNSIANNEHSGIYWVESEGVNITNNDINLSDSNGIFLDEINGTPGWDRVERNHLDSNVYGIYLYEKTQEVQVVNNTINSSSSFGIRLTPMTDAPHDNILLNNLIVGSTSMSISDETGGGNNNYLVYNLSGFGEMFWNDSDWGVAVRQNVTNETGFGYNFWISENNLFLNASALTELNRTAILTVYDTNQYGFIKKAPYRDRVECTPILGCGELSSADTFVFYATFFSNYSVNESADDGMEDIYPSVAIGPDNIIHVVFQRYSEEMTAIPSDPSDNDLFDDKWVIMYMNSTDNGTTWGMPTNVSGPFNMSAASEYGILHVDDFADIDVDSTGVIHVVWQRYNLTYFGDNVWMIMYTNSSDNGTTWTKPKAIRPHAFDPFGTGYWDDINPAITVDHNDTVHVVWQSNNGSGPGAMQWQGMFTYSNAISMSGWHWKIYHTNLTFVDPWDTMWHDIGYTNCTNDPFGQGGPQGLCMFPDLTTTKDKVHVVWQFSSISGAWGYAGYDVLYANSTDWTGNTFSNAGVRVCDGIMPDGCVYPRIDKEKDEELHVVYFKYHEEWPLTSLHVYYTNSTANWTSWQTGLNLSGSSPWSTVETNIYPVIAVDNNYEYNYVNWRRNVTLYSDIWQRNRTQDYFWNPAWNFSNDPLNDKFPWDEARSPAAIDAANYSFVSSPWHEMNITIVDFDIVVDGWAKIIDIKAPTWTGNQTNGSDATRRGYSVHFNITLLDEIGPGKYIFCFFNGTDQVNTTPAAWVNNTKIQITKTITATQGQLVEWYWWFNDSSGNTNQTRPWNFTVDNTPPTQGTPILNSTLGTNLTTENLTCYNVSTFDPDLAAVTNIYNWFVNGTPMASLNMPFDTNSSTTTKDYSGHGNNGTIKNAKWVPSGVVGGSMYFDNVNDRILIPSDASLNFGTGSFSIVFWMNSTTAVKDTLFCKSNDSPMNPGGLGWRMMTRTSGQGIVLELGDGTNSKSRNPLNANCTNGSWHHVAVVIDRVNDVSYGYFDGNLDKTIADAYGIVGSISSSNNTTIGVNCWNLLSDYNGSLDEVQFYKRALSAGQIGRIYNDTKDGYTDNRTITKQETGGPGEIWSCNITPNDALADGITKSSGNLTILASPDAQAPVVYSMTPANDTWTGDPTLDITFNATDETSATLDCTMYIAVKASTISSAHNASVWNNTVTPMASNYTFTKNVNYTWWVNCTDGSNENKSEVRIIKVDLMDPIIQWVNATPDPVVQENVINLTANITENMSGIYTVLFCINGTNYTYQGVSGTVYWYAGWDTNVEPKSYNYTVYANDTAGNEATPNSSNFTVQVAMTTLTLPVNLVNFQVINILQSNNTSDGSPTPFLMQNDGNVFVNVSIYANASIFQQSVLGSTDFQFMAGNYSLEPNSFKWNASQITWASMPNSSNQTKVVAELDFNNSKDLAESEIYVRVPSVEPEGNKMSGIIYIATRS